MDIRARLPQQNDDLARVGLKTRFQARRSALLCPPCPLPPQAEGLEKTRYTLSSTECPNDLSQYTVP